MRICIYEDALDMGKHAAHLCAEKIRQALEEKEIVSIIIATGASQFSLFEALITEAHIDWQRVEVFHLDEYIGIDSAHPASFRKYLTERFVQHLPALYAFHPIEGDAIHPEEEVSRLNTLISAKEISVACIGIGENGHLAFNDPPADLTTTDPYHIVTLDQACRAQQVGEGWFSSIEEVPTQAISMTISHILQSACIICSVPDKRKASAVHMAIYGPIDALHPASSLQQHPNCYLMIDKAASSRIV